MLLPFVPPSRKVRKTIGDIIQGTWIVRDERIQNRSLMGDFLYFYMKSTNSIDGVKQLVAQQPNQGIQELEQIQIAFFKQQQTEQVPKLPIGGALWS